MSEEATVVAEGWINTKEAAELADYTRDYIRRLARQGRIRADKVTRDWLINKESLLEHKRTVRRGRPKESKG